MREPFVLYPHYTGQGNRRTAVEGALFFSLFGPKAHTNKEILPRDMAGMHLIQLYRIV